MVKTRQQMIEFLLSNKKVDSITLCWIWPFSKINDKSPYGQISWNGRRWLVHRLSAHLFRGFNPDTGLLALHECDNPPCWNPDHLFEGTKADNLIDSFKKNRRPSTAGEENGRSKLREIDVLRIKRLAAIKTISLNGIGRKFNISGRQVALIVGGKRWTYLQKAKLEKG